ncbi:hypothetical protein MNBD_GAMMA18-431 [hydrothermal vent metagenome]|uniref:Uncharacterized protein n=1 Tax=hydrothermal vent metagenome TaxID=652676 RepID=A0A3B0Z8Z6_9ZZZZ
MDQAELELQLEVWKDLAISNQVLMRTATDALKLDPECSTEELKEALDNAIKRSLDADATIDDAQKKAQQAIAVMKEKIAASEKAQAISETIVSETLEAQKLSEQQMTVERDSHIKEMKKGKKQVADTEKALKAINKALADTPENVMKKLRTLKKQKSDEATACKLAENSVRTLKKEKTKLEQDLKASEEKETTLVEQYRELHKLCGELHGQLKPLVDDESTLPAIPALDEEMLNGNESEAEKK